MTRTCRHKSRLDERARACVAGVLYNTYTYYHSWASSGLTEMASQDTQMKSLQGLEELKQEANSAIENQNRKENQTWKPFFFFLSELDMP